MAITTRDARSSWRSRFPGSSLEDIAIQLYASRDKDLSALCLSQSSTLSISTNSPSDSPPPIKVVCISDTHNERPTLAAGDLLVHAGDLTEYGTRAELQACLDWLAAQPHTHKVVVAGNHDLLLDKTTRPHRESPKVAAAELASLKWHGLIYLENSSVTLSFSAGRKLLVHGSPHTPAHGMRAFQYTQNNDIFSGTIPFGVDVLVTHGPARWQRDMHGWGDAHLLAEMRRTRPRLHVFGHIHEGAGVGLMQWDEFQVRYERLRAGVGSSSDAARMVAMADMAKTVGWDRKAEETMVVNAASLGKGSGGKAVGTVVEF